MSSFVRESLTSTSWLSYTLIYVILVVLIGVGGYSVVSMVMDRHLQADFVAQKNRLSGVLGAHRKIAERFVDQQIMTPVIVEALELSGKGAGHEKHELQQRIHPIYDAMRCYGINLLRIYGPDGACLLHFNGPAHQEPCCVEPQRAQLTPMSISAPVHGYRTDPLLSGFRYFFPLVHQNRTVGLVEIGQPIASVLVDMESHDCCSTAISYALIIKKREELPAALNTSSEVQCSCLQGEEGYVNATGQLASRPDGKPSRLSLIPPELSAAIGQIEERRLSLHRGEDFILYPVGSSPSAVFFESLEDIQGRHTAYLIMAVTESRLKTLHVQFAVGVTAVSAGLLILMIGVYRHMKIRQERHRTSELLGIISKNMGESLYATDVYGKITFINDAACLLLGCDSASVVGKNAHHLFHVQAGGEDPCCRLLDELDSISHAHEDIQVLRKANGDVFHAECLSTKMVVHRKPVGIVTVFRDISRRLARDQELRQMTNKLEHANKELTRLARIDGLTGLANRRWFDESLDCLWKKSLRNGHEFAVLMVDIDHFKAFNDHYGHLAGDECLKSVAKTLCECCKRPGDVVARYGGEEFAILLPETKGRDALHVAKRIQVRLQSQAIEHQMSPVLDRLTVSIGISSRKAEPGVEVVDLVGEADRCLYHAKSGGRNQVVGLFEDSHGAVLN
nr:diguanylate cyclase [uncultured Desulfuromonas sp.]